MPTKRMHRGLVALSASAVAAIYMVGYVRTQSADATIGALETPTLTVALSSTSGTGAAPTSPAGATSAAGSAATVTPLPAPTVEPFVSRQPPLGSRLGSTPQPTAVPGGAGSAAAVSAAQAGYKDGTYTGQGASRRGDVSVSVAVQGGRIASVTITRSTLQYPLRDIAGLPGQVVQRQSAQVDIVSRATYSSQAFRGAVAQALSKAT